LALLLAKLELGEILNPALRSLAIDLLQSVDPSQQWGITAPVSDQGLDGAEVALKNGWWWVESGWWVNSAGIVVPDDGTPAYAIAILTSEQPSWSYGIETIEEVAAMIHQHLRECRDPDN
jgi:hypothetical protein